ncbi:PAS domain-containing protein [Sphingobacterium pedocola]|uniref:histidine kinase n=1 Tax=Sphingobacterium pedocola TaxID=2082722 RepID=A0ABR9TAC7_9SPHI|nr:PAS domain-containing protein [Sphingobacterium pedocola]MBE8722007.1 hypothetical protein [Sphingobacterium pedocola]
MISSQQKTGASDQPNGFLLFLRGSGECARHLTSLDWERTELGAIANWPPALKQATATMLSSNVPTLLCWGSSLIQLYNAHFEFILDHYFLQAPILGIPAEQTFRSDWHAFSPLFTKALQGEASEWNQYKVKKGKHDALADCYFDISFTPIRDELGKVQGVGVTFADRTPAVQELKTLRSYKQNVDLMIHQAPVGICIVIGTPLRTIEVNDAFVEITGKQREDFFRLPYWDVNAEIRDVYEPISLRVIQTGQSYQAKEHRVTLIRNGIPETVYVDFVYEPLRDTGGQIIGLMIVAIDVTAKSTAQQVLEQTNEEMAAINEEIASANEELITTNEDLEFTQRKLHISLERLTESEHQMREMVERAPFPIGVYIGKEMRITHANQAIKDVWGKGDEVVGKMYAEVLPELADQEIYPQLDSVYSTGIPFHTRNQLVVLHIEGRPQDFYFNYSFTPLRNHEGQIYGVMNTAADVTDLYQAKQKVEQSERNFYNMIQQAPVAMCLLLGPEHTVALVNDAMIDIWGKARTEVLHRPLFEALPDARKQGLEEVMAQVYNTGIPYQAIEQPVSLIRHGVPDVVYQSFVYQPYYNADGSILGVLAISVNVTEQVTARLELERVYEQSRLAKEAASLGTFDFNVLTGILEWDRRCRELFGVTHDRPVTLEKDFKEALHPDDVDRVFWAISRAMDEERSGGIYSTVYRTITGANRQERWIKAQGKAYFDKDAKPLRLIGSVLDITDQKLHEIRIEENAEKHGRLAAIIDSTDDIIIGQTLGGYITSWNRAAERHLGYSTEEAVGKHISLIHPSSRFEEATYLASLVSEGQQVVNFETVRLDKEGNEKQLSITVSPVLDGKGQVIGSSKIARDISVQKAAEKAARRYTMRLEVLNKMIQTVAEELDLDRILQKVIAATCELTGAAFGSFFYAKKDIDGKVDLVYATSSVGTVSFTPSDIAASQAFFSGVFTDLQVNRVANTDEDPRYQLHKYLFGMPSVDFHVSSYLAVPVVSRSGEVIGGLFFGHPDPERFSSDHESLVISIAAHAAVGLDNAQLYEKVKSLNDKKDEFIGLASHELKTPLTSINGYLQILERSNQNEQHHLFLKRATLQVKKLAMLVDDLLDVSKIEAGKLKLTLVDFDLLNTIKEAIDLVALNSNKHHITFKTVAESCVVKADSHRIEQVMLNLLTNAIKYAPGKTEIEVSLLISDSEVLVGVKDFGIGIPIDKQDTIFSRFYRIEENTQNISGLGMGLFLSHEIITRHQGRIWVDSVLGRGSTFWFSLPLNSE